MSEGLFDEPRRHIPEPLPKLSASARLRHRQKLAIGAGRHPLGDLPGGPFRRGVLRLHPDASREIDRELVPAGAPTCGTCRFRHQVHGGAKDYPKCTWGRVVTPSPAGDPPGSVAGVRVRVGPRETHGEQTDVRAWWPACVDYEEAR